MAGLLELVHGCDLKLLRIPCLDCFDCAQLKRQWMVGKQKRLQAGTLTELSCSKLISALELSDRPLDSVSQRAASPRSTYGSYLLRLCLSAASHAGEHTPRSNLVVTFLESCWNLVTESGNLVGTCWALILLLFFSGTWKAGICKR